tara:strand:- start:78 stop:203 length:126 start_codon:yes stop_codon:yes gene_type:complete
MKLRYLDLQKIIKKIDDTADWDIIAQLEETYELWTWHPGMG